jgi:5-methylcytosine-specific restriction endonuclease McrA
MTKLARYEPEIRYVGTGEYVAECVHADGGLHHPTNLQPLCRPCNERKQARTADYRTPQQRAAVEAVRVIEFKKLEQA